MKRIRNKGITLIALVITIVILLILAGVSIVMLTGNNGILTQTKLAKENTAAAKEDEENKLANNNEYINEQLGNAVPGKVVVETKKDNYVDSNGDKATIPADFIVDETENTISKGLVVHGPDKVNGDNGSEFVWVPVPDINSMSQCSTAGGDCNLQLENDSLKCKTHNDNEIIVGKLYATIYGENFGIINTIYNENEGEREPAILKNYDNDVSYNNLFTLESLKTDYRNMAISVAKYGGFYVGRYETSLSTATSESTGKSGSVQSKQGVIPTSANNSATSMWYGLYKVQNKTYTGKNNSVESSMIWGSQYDRIINLAKEGEDKEKIRNTSLGNNSSGSIVTTGNNKYLEDSINNIRDLGGNLREWTLDAYSIEYRASRGGNYEVEVSPCYRNNNNPNNESIYYGSRLALYIK